ncbi:MAG: glycoside hydrolase family 2 TIM barrel-domain containing protein [Bacteroidota bacterium]
MKICSLLLISIPYSVLPIRSTRWITEKLCILICTFSFFAKAQEKVDYQRVYLSGKDAAHTVDWDFMVTDGAKSGEWGKIPVPSNWELHGYGSYNYGHDHKNPDRKLGKEHGLYQHRFTVPADWKGKSINLVFDGVMTDTKVKINGKSAGVLHQGAFQRFKYDIGKFLKYGVENLLEVDVAKHSANASVNRAERQADFWIFGGIFRPVFLEVLPPKHFARIALDARHKGDFTALLELNAPLKNAAARITLRNLEGNRLGEILEKPIEKRQTTISISGKFPEAKSWNPESPKQYYAVIELLEKEKVVYRTKECFGFRTVELKKNDGFYVNGRKVVFKGVNRHSFWPDTGRALSEANHFEDIRLMKEMNMNAVRMSHYGPDERFLELCDSLGLFVLDELTGWQDGYDTVVGPKLIKELVLKDENHPSVIIWDHGNEGGWNFANEKWFHAYDIQKRPIIYPWLKRNGVDTRHYPTYAYGINRLQNGNEPFMPTEFLHGLYDGGHGAGLADYWHNYAQNPVFSGGFLWDFTDEAVVRTDRNGQLDSDGNHAPDGILGPYREKEGSFYTIKEVWSPVQIAPISVTSSFDGRIRVGNRYSYTNLKDCSFSWQVLSIKGLETPIKIVSGETMGPDVEPGETRFLQLDTPNRMAGGQLFSLTAKDSHGMEIYTWHWPIQTPAEFSREVLDQMRKEERNEVALKEQGGEVIAQVNGLKFHFNKQNGYLEKVFVNDSPVSFRGGPKPEGIAPGDRTVKWSVGKGGDFILESLGDSYPEKFQWKLKPNGLLRLEASPLHLSKGDIDFIGISFRYPEEKVKGITWMGQGPYRVWKNRLQGTEIGVWEKDYNNTVTGFSFDRLIYPEFKGYHGNLYWAVLETEETPIGILTETPNLYLGLFAPDDPENAKGGVTPPFPEGELSFLYDIPPVGTKFKQADQLGPSSQKSAIGFHQGDESNPLVLWFVFNSL